VYATMRGLERKDRTMIQEKKYVKMKNKVSFFCCNVSYGGNWFKY
jgi:hypothetical protein